MRYTLSTSGAGGLGVAIKPSAAVLFTTKGLWTKGDFSTGVGVGADGVDGACGWASAWVATDDKK